MVTILVLSISVSCEDLDLEDTTYFETSGESAQFESLENQSAPNTELGVSGYSKLVASVFDGKNYSEDREDFYIDNIGTDGNKEKKWGEPKKSMKFYSGSEKDTVYKKEYIVSFHRWEARSMRDDLDFNSKTYWDEEIPDACWTAYRLVDSEWEEINVCPDEIVLYFNLTIKDTVPPPSPAIQQEACIDTTKTFFWRRSPSDYSVKYRFQLSKNQTFNAASLVVDTQLTALNKNVGGLERNQTYYWRVRASNQYGASAWSVTDTVKTRPASPAISGTTVLNGRPKLYWSSVCGADEYKIQKTPNPNTARLSYYRTTQSTSFVDHGQTGLNHSADPLRPAYQYAVISVSKVTGCSSAISNREFFFDPDGDGPIIW